MDIDNLAKVHDEFIPATSVAHVPRVPESEEGDDIMIEDRVLNAEERATEYVARPYVEINDDVDDIRNAVQENMQTGCCRNNCYNSIDCNEIYMHILQMRELTSEEKDMYLIGKLKCKGIEGNGNEEKRKRYMYSFGDRDVCKSVFLFSHDIGEKSLKNLQKHMKTNGITPRVHGNVGKRPKHALEFETVKFAFKPVKAVRKYHHFRFSSLNPGVVFVKETSDPTEAEVPHQLLKRPGTVFDGTLPQVLPPGGLSVERQAYLYKSIRPFVREAYKDTLCPRAHEE